MTNGSHWGSIRATCCASAVIAGMAATAPARAQGAAAEVLFNEGLAAKDKGDFETCAKQLRESDRLDPAVGTKLNLAACEEKRGRLATAWDLYRAVADTAEANDPRRQLAKKEAAALEPRVPRVTIRLEEGAHRETTVRLGDTQFEAASFGVPLPVDPGEHELVVSAPGRSDAVVRLDIAEGQREEIKVAPGDAKASDPAGDGAKASPSRDVGKGGSGGGSKTLGYVFGGVGLVGIGAGAVAGVMAIGKKSTADDNCDDRLRVCTQEGKDADSDGRTLAGISTVGFVVGIVGLGAGAYFLLTSGGGSGQGAALRTRVGPGSADVTFVRTF